MDLSWLERRNCGCSKLYQAYVRYVERNYFDVGRKDSLLFFDNSTFEDCFKLVAGHLIWLVRYTSF